MLAKVMGFARLARPANLPTAAADILAGITLGLYFGGVDILDFLKGNISESLTLIFASVFLYAGGVALNDVFDAKLDAQERPERPIPSGLISLWQALVWAVGLLAIGIILAFCVKAISGYLALALSLAILSYDGWAKSHLVLGPLNMGLCRGLNLLLGMSVLGQVYFWWLALVPIAYIFAVTLISRGEVHGDNKGHLQFSAVLYAIVIFGMLGFIGYYGGNLWAALPFFALFVFLIYRPLYRAYRENSPERIKKAVMGGVLSLIVMDACWVAGMGGWSFALPVLILLPLSFLLSKLFAVT